jgi:UDP-N-acetylmuramate--alanine ligase
MGEYDPSATYFGYEADEFDRNFLSFRPYISLIAGIDWDHPDIYPTRENYNQAFREFLEQSDRAVMWNDDAQTLNIIDPERSSNPTYTLLSKDDTAINDELTLPGLVNRQNAWLVVRALQDITQRPHKELIAYLNTFPGVSRRFEQLLPNLYTDYAHTPGKIRGALQLAHEVNGEDVVVVYEGLHNTRQHFIQDDLRHLFDTVKHVYIVPSYLAREDKNLPLLSPADLQELLSDVAKAKSTPAEINETLAARIRHHLEEGDLVLCLTAGGGHSLDEWLRQTFATV